MMTNLKKIDEPEEVSLERMIKECDAEIAATQELRLMLRKRFNRIRSINFIRVNKITKKNVCDSDDSSYEYFGDVFTFAKWMKANVDVKWLSWDGGIYLSSDIREGRMDRVPVGLFEDVV